jgi:PIN domain nuclease of toxin-antitoxin system
MNREDGWEQAKAVVPGGIVSSLIYAEVVTRLTLRGGSTSKIDGAWEELECAIEPFTAERARAAGLLVAATRERGLSLADRACLALGLELRLPVFTTDRVWAGLKVGADVRLIR